MKKNSKYIDDTLIKLRRHYSKDETVKALNKRMAELEFNNGVLKSELDESNYLLSKELEKEKNIKELEDKIIEIESDFKNTLAYKKLQAKVINMTTNFKQRKTLCFWF